MHEKIYSPGETVEQSGLYPVVDSEGNEQGYEVTVVQGEPFPPTPEKGWGFGTPRLAKTTSSSEDETTLSTSLPGRRPIFQDDSALVQSDALPEGRPILKGAKRIASLGHLPLHRPIFHSDLNIVKMHGNRPVLRLDSKFAPSTFLPENRPVIVQGAMLDQTLMGYLD